jgi:spore coat polysaccharide biosynthesis protein SpsF
MNTIAIIQARMSSSRLPGKVMQDLGGKPMLLRAVERARRASLVHDVWVATTSDPSDDPIQELCNAEHIPFARGSMHDVLDRYYQAAKSSGAAAIVRLTADCPLLDPGLVDITIQAFLDRADFAANRLPPPWTRSFPIGLDTEVCSLRALERAWNEAQEAYQREHVLPYLYEGVNFEQITRQPPVGETYVLRGTSQRGFRVAQVHHFPDYGALRWTVDTPQDLTLVREIFSRLADKPEFGWLDVLGLFENDPSLAGINADVQHKTAFDVDSRIEK